MKVSNERLDQMLAGLQNHGGAKLATIYTADFLSALTELLSLRNAQSEAVAWRGQHMHPQGQGRWVYVDGPGKPHIKMGGLTSLEPLYTHPAPQSEAVAVKALLHHVHKMLGYHIVSPPTPDHQFVNVCNGDLRVLAELFEAAALTHPAPPLAVTDEMVEAAARALVPVWYGGFEDQRQKEDGSGWLNPPGTPNKRALYAARAILTAALEAKQ